MSINEMLKLLNSSGIPFIYHVWLKPPEQLPWGVFRFNSTDKFFADGTVYYKIDSCEIELYTAIKSPEIEKQLEDTLTAAGISFAKDEQYIESEQFFEILYVCEV